jgi:4-hydroxy-tetrahydrodipicolinate synthase
MLFKGSIVALVTPFKKGAVDTAALSALVRWHLAEGTHGILVNGTTGESPTLAPEEQDLVLKTALEAARGRVPVIAGVGTNNTAKTVERARSVAALGASGLLVVTPYYNRPVQAGLLEHFGAVARAVKTPIIIYHIPGRTGVSLTPETVAVLTKYKNIVAIKDASGDLKFAQELRVRLGDRLAILSGEDILNLPLASIGSCGSISVVANVAPGMMAAMYEAVFEGDFERAVGLHLGLLDLHKGLFMETNPIPVKAALHLMRRIGPEIRLPLTRLPSEKVELMKGLLHKQGILS